MKVFRSFIALVAVTAFAQQHPLDGLTTSEYWTVYDVLQKTGHAGPESYFASVLLRAPAKDAATHWRTGYLPMPREADVIMLQKGVTYEARVDITGKKLVSWQAMPGVQAPFLRSEMSGHDESIKKDPQVLEAFKKRGITDLNTVRCVSLPVSYVSVPEQETARIGFGSCSQNHGVYHSWGRSIEGLTVQIDMVSKKILKVIDTGAVPVGQGVNYEEIPENPRAGTTPISISQPMGVAYKMEKGEVSWQNWRFRFRLDQRLGVVLNLVRYLDGARQRSVMYEGSISELYVPYMDPSHGWNNRVFIDAGEFFTGGILKPLRAGLDCPATATYFDALTVGEHGAPKVGTQRACLFERTGSDPAWRHGEDGEVYGRPSRELVLRSAAVIGNYDYIMDWRFLQDGAIDVAVGATGVIETKSVADKMATHDHAGGLEYGKLVAPNTMGVNHDHFFSYRLDMDVDGPKNSFMAERLVQQMLPDDPMRKSIWAVQPSIAKTEKDAILDLRLDRPAMWMFVNPNVKGPLGYPTGYEIMAGATATSLLAPDDLPQKLGGFSAHQFWVTPYDTAQRYASGVYPTSSKANDGLADWVKANRAIENTDLVGWYTLGFHHVPRAEDWPVMPTMWHSFQIRPFHFFAANPALDLPKAQ